MASYPARRRDRPMQAYVVRVYSPSAARAPAGRFAVLALDSGGAMAAVIACLDLCDIAEITDEVLAPAVAAGLGLEPGRPLRLT